MNGSPVDVGGRKGEASFPAGRCKRMGLVRKREVDTTPSRGAADDERKHRREDGRGGRGREWK